MIALIESIFGSSLGKWIAEIVMMLAVATGGYLYIEHRGATDELAKLKISSTALVAKASAEIVKETSAHAADVKANQEKTDAALAANTALQSNLDQRVRDFDTYRRAHPDVASPAGVTAPAQPGECGAVSCGDLAVQLAERGNDLADSLGQTVAALQSCQRDRDSLTGLPKDIL